MELLFKVPLFHAFWALFLQIVACSTGCAVVRLSEEGGVEWGCREAVKVKQVVLLEFEACLVIVCRIFPKVKQVVLVLKLR